VGLYNLHIYEIVSIYGNMYVAVVLLPNEANEYAGKP